MRKHAGTDSAKGFELPAAYKTSARQHDHMIAIASLIASVSIVTIIGAQFLGML